MDDDVVVDGNSVVKSASTGDDWIRARVPISQQLESQRLQRPRRRFHPNSRDKCRTEDFFENCGTISVPITASPGIRNRIYPTGTYICGNLSPTANNPTSHQAAASPSNDGLALLKAARDGEDHLLRDHLRRAVLVGISEGDLNATDSSGRVSFFQMKFI